MRKTHFIHFLLLTLVMAAMPALSSAQISVGVGLSVHIGPPALPVYAQPICPGPGYIWTPGYWAYGPSGYYWVPGTWVVAPAVGLLWTPGYWGWGGGAYLWHAGYWGPHVGFYGGINYGFGYGGVGYVGGFWNHGVFAYNTAVTNVNTTIIHNTYINRTVINNVTVNHVSYNGGAGGISARPTPGEQAAMREQHTAATGEQMQHEQTARSNRAMLASVNHGRPLIAATPKAGQFEGHGVVTARASAPRPPANAHNVPRPQSSVARSEARPTPTHMNNVAASPHQAAPRPQSRPQAASEPREAGGGEHHAGGREGGGRPR
jgi:YXWGXW repeat-containing protein